MNVKYAPVAQLDRVSDSDSEGRAFESHQAYQLEALNQIFGSGFFFMRKAVPTRSHDGTAFCNRFSFYGVPALEPFFPAKRSIVALTASMFFLRINFFSSGVCFPFSIKNSSNTLLPSNVV